MIVDHVESSLSISNIEENTNVTEFTVFLAFHIVGLVTFRRKKYMTVREFEFNVIKIGSGTRKNGNQTYSSNLGTIFDVLSI